MRSLLRIPRQKSLVRYNQALSTFSRDESSAPVDEGNWVTGTVLDHSVDVSKLRVGDRIDPPYETTLDMSFRDHWLSSFHSNDRINVSTPFARQLGFQDAVLPFSMMLFLAGAMTHADAATVQLGYRNAAYHWPAFAKDTITRSFVLKRKRDTADGRNSIFTFGCTLRNQRGKVVFTADKTMLFSNHALQAPTAASSPELKTPFRGAEAQRREQQDDEMKRNGRSPFHGDIDDDDEDWDRVGMLNQGRAFEGRLWRHLVESVPRLVEAGESQSLVPLRPGQLLLHSTCRPLSATQAMQLSSLARVTHPRHFNHHVYNIDEIFIPGGLVFGLTASAASRDLHEVLHEELTECHFVNNVHPGDTVGALTFVKELDENVSGDLEALTITTVGVKNLDVGKDLVGVRFPCDLFVSMATRRDLEALCEAKCPELSNRVVCVLERRVLRQTPRTQTFLL